MARGRKRSVVPKKHVSFNRNTVVLGAQDEDLLRDGWLNDNVIEYCMFRDASSFKANKKKVLVLNTKFYTRMMTDRPKPDVSNIPREVQAGLERADFLHVQRDVLNLFYSKFMIFPLHLASHWILVAIVVPDADGVPDNPEPNEAAACILFFDSKHDHLPEEVVDSVSDDLRALLTCIWYFQMHRTDGHKNIVFTMSNCPMIVMDVPQQSNAKDCGVHLIQSFHALMSKVDVFHAKCMTNWHNIANVADYFATQIHVDEDTRESLLSSL